MLSLDVLTYTMLSLVTCLIPPPVLLSPDIRYDILDSYNYHDNGNDDLTSWYVPVQTVFLILLTCSCWFSKSGNYLIKNKMRQLTSGQGNLRILICICVYNGIRYVVQPKLLIRPKGLQMFWGEHWPPTSYYIHEKRHTIRLSSRPCGRFRTPATECHGPWSRACTGPTANIACWYPVGFQ